MSITVDGQGSGHGRGMSAWGNYGSAVNLRWPWQDILAYYYGGTQAATAANSPIKVRLFALDNAPSTGVVSTVGQAIWNRLPNTYCRPMRQARTSTTSTPRRTCGARTRRTAKFVRGGRWSPRA